MKNLHVNDVGTIFKSTILDEDGDVVDISSLISATISFKKPNDIKIDRTPTLYTDGTDGILSYVTVSGDINMNGLWSLQVVANLSGGTYYTDIYDFRVERNL